MEIIKVDHLTKDYGQGRGVFDVSFEVGKGEVFGFLGPNGAGKSTTIRHLMGFSKPMSGNTYIFGKETFTRYDEILKDVGYIPGEIALPQGLTGYEFIDMMQHLVGVKNDDRLHYLMDIFALDPQGETKRMSLGVKRKLAIVTAFMHDPSVLILDEPTSGLDPVMQEVFIDFVKQEKERGKTILLSSHIFSEVDATCDRIAIIKDGRIVSEFVADDLRHNATKIYSIELASSDDYALLLSRCEDADYMKVLHSDSINNTVEISTEDKDVDKVIATLATMNVADFSHKKETLEDYFMSYYKEDKDYKEAMSWKKR